jgi:nicotinamidase-related amidase
MPLSTLDPTTTALVLIDLQRGIAAMPCSPYESCDVISNAAQLAEKFRALGAPVFLVHVVRSADGKDALHPDADDPMVVRQLMPDFSEIVPELGPQEADIVIDKRNWGAFYGTPLDLMLRRRGIATIVLAGISTSVGVESTARDAYERGYDQVFVEDAMSARSPEDHAHSVHGVFRRMGRVASTAEVLRALGS